MGNIKETSLEAFCCHLLNLFNSMKGLIIAFRSQRLFFFAFNRRFMVT